MKALPTFSMALLALATAGAVFLYSVPSRATGSSNSNGPASGTMSASAPASEPQRSEATSSVTACKRDEDRLAKLQANPTVEEATGLAGELKCTKLAPQLLAILDQLRHAIEEAPPSGPIGAEARSAVAAPQAAEAISAHEGAPPPSAPAPLEGDHATSDAGRNPDDDRLARLRTTPTNEEAVRFAEGVSKGTGAERNATTEIQSVVDADRRIAALERENKALAEEVGSLQRNQESLAGHLAAPASPQPAMPAEGSEAQPAPQAAADAVRSVSEPGAALASLPEGMPARVLIRYLTHNPDARSQAEKLASALKRQGVELADLRESRTAIRTEISFSYAPDEAIAQQVGRLVGVAPVRRLQAMDGLMIRPGSVELSLSGDGRFAAIKTTSARGSNP